MSDGADDPKDDDLRALPGEAEPPAELERRVVAALRAQGLLAPRPRAPRWWLLAAGLSCFAVGWAARDIAARPPAPRGDGPLYLLLLSQLPDSDGAAEARRVEEYRAWAVSLRRGNRLVRAEKLGDESSVLGAGPAATDTSGVFLIRAASMEEALALARACPHLRHGGSITIRSIDPT
jgi:hypothetical protein